MGFGVCVCRGGGIRLKRGDKRKYGGINKTIHSSISVTASVIIRRCQSLFRNSLLATSAMHKVRHCLFSASGHSFIFLYLSLFFSLCCTKCKFFICSFDYFHWYIQVDPKLWISLVIWATELDTSLSSSICQPASICRYRARGLSLFRGDKVKMVIELDDLSSSMTYRAR